MAYVYYQQMINRYINKLNNIGSSSVNCTIFIGSITGFFGKNCNINIINSCLNNQDVINSLLLTSLAETLETIVEPALKESILNILGIQSIENITTSLFQTQCNALSLINNNISILQLNFSTCIANEPITLEFINTGNAMASCGLSSILNAFITADSNNNIESKSIINTTYIIYIILSLFIATSLLLILLHYKNKQSVIYIMDYKKKDNTNLNNLIAEMKSYIT
jgi:hypothetical protein